MNETTLRNLLHDVAAETPQHTVVDSYLAVRTAQRHRHLRQRLVTIGAAALVLLVTVATVVVAVAVRDRPAPPATPRQAPTSFDPLNLRVTTGWLPDGYSQGQMRITASDIRITFGSAARDGVITVYLAPRERIVVEQVLAPASVPGVAIPRTLPPGTPGPDVGGRSSRWYPEGSRMNAGGPADRLGQLRFQWAPDAVGLVDISGVADPRDVAVRVAKALRVEPGAPTRLPFALTEPLPHPVFELVTSGANTTDARIDVQYGTSYQNTPATIAVHSAGPSDRPLGRLRPVGRWQAEVPDSGPNGSDLVRFAPTADTIVEVSAARPDALRLVEGYRVTGDLRDPSTWE